MWSTRKLVREDRCTPTDNPERWSIWKQMRGIELPVEQEENWSRPQNWRTCTRCNPQRLRKNGSNSRSGWQITNRIEYQINRWRFWRRQEPFLARNPICDFFAVGEFALVCVCCAVFLRSRRLSFLRAGVVFAAFTLEIVVRDGQRWLSNAEKKFVDPGQGTCGKVLADVITIDGRKEWICKFCSESNVWLRRRRRRCYSNIPAGLRKHTGRRLRRERVSGPLVFLVVKWRRGHEVPNSGGRDSRASRPLWAVSKTAGRRSRTRRPMKKRKWSWGRLEHGSCGGGREQCAWCRHTRGRFERTIGRVFSVSHHNTQDTTHKTHYTIHNTQDTTHKTHYTIHNTQDTRHNTQHTTHHNTPQQQPQQHTETEKEDGERRQRKREKRRWNAKDKRRWNAKDKRRWKTRDKREEKMEDERQEKTKDKNPWCRW